VKAITLLVQEDSVEKDPIEQSFTVTDLTKEGSIIKYTVEGLDSQGPFSVKRRFNDFTLLRKVLLARWPGCYIPCIISAAKIADLKLKYQKQDEFIEI
jgi:hypothetical protein